MSDPTDPSPDWYDDPEHPGQLRYWDGTRWTEQRQPAGAAAAPTPEAPAPDVQVPTAEAPAAEVPTGATPSTVSEAGVSKKLLAAIAVGGAVLIFILIAVVASSGGDDSGGSGDQATENAEDAAGDGGDELAGGLGPADAVPYVDPEGEYVIATSPDWQVDPDSGPTGIEFFVLGTGSTTFADNANVVTERTQGAPLDAYVEVSLANLETAIDNVSIDEPEFVTLASGQEGAIITYTGTLQGVDIAFMVVIALEDDLAALATLSSEPDRFDEIRADAEPYLLTLAATP